MPYCAHSSTFKIPFHQAASRVTGKVKLSEIHLDGKRVNQELAVPHSVSMASRFAASLQHPAIPTLFKPLEFESGRI